LAAQGFLAAQGLQALAAQGLQALAAHGLQAFAAQGFLAAHGFIEASLGTMHSATPLAAQGLAAQGLQAFAAHGLQAFAAHGFFAAQGLHAFFGAQAASTTAGIVTTAAVTVPTPSMIGTTVVDSSRFLMGLIWFIPSLRTGYTHSSVRTGSWPHRDCRSWRRTDCRSSSRHTGSSLHTGFWRRRDLPRIRRGRAEVRR